VYEYPRVSPDGTRLVFGTSNGQHAVISTYELSGASAVRQLTFEGNSRFPVWSGAGTHVAFQSDRHGDPAIFWQPADGSIAEKLTTPDAGTSHTPESWSPDGNVLLFRATKGLMSSLWMFSLKDQTSTPFADVRNSTVPTNAMFSPDGRWVAYQIGHAGVTEGTLYVQPFPPNGSKYLIAQQGGRPLWSRDGKELFFVPGPNQFVVVGVKTTPAFTATSRVDVHRGFLSASPTESRTFDMTPDGRIVGVVSVGQNQSGSPAQIEANQIGVVLNWFEELTLKVPEK
jgi:serine/threonine-protein kinase